MIARLYSLLDKLQRRCASLAASRPARRTFPRHVIRTGAVTSTHSLCSLSARRLISYSRARPSRRSRDSWRKRGVEHDHVKASLPFHFAQSIEDVASRNSTLPAAWFSSALRRAAATASPDTSSPSTLSQTGARCSANAPLKVKQSRARPRARERAARRFSRWSKNDPVF